MIGMEQSAVSHQLRMLRHLGLVTGERNGRTVIYALYDSHVAMLLDEAVHHAEHLRLDLNDRPAGGASAAGHHRHDDPAMRPRCTSVPQGQRRGSIVQQAFADHGLECAACLDELAVGAGLGDAGPSMASARGKARPSDCRRTPLTSPAAGAPGDGQRCLARKRAAPGRGSAALPRVLTPAPRNACRPGGHVLAATRKEDKKSMRISACKNSEEILEQGWPGGSRTKATLRPDL